MSTARTAPAGIADHVDALPPGTRLGEFEITALLGVGGFGMVYQAFDHSLLRFVAIKEYMPATLAGRAEGQSLWVRSSSDAQSFQAGLASFVSEARLLAQFDHPSLVKVFRFWEANSTAYMVMPLYSGMTLKQARAHMRTPPTEEWLRKVLWSVTSALRVLHDGQTLHRDISPDNIFLQDAGPPVLLDLGAARRAIQERDGRYTAVLKVNYAPIEQYAEAGSQLPQGPWSDLYSLGAVVHGCLCNDAPLPATLRAIRDRMVSFPRVARTVRKQFGVEYSRPFIDAVSQCLALQPEDRPQSIDEFLQAMQMTTAPGGLEHFDFRAELGDIWVEPAGPDARGVAAGPVINASEFSQPYPMGPAPGAPRMPAPTPAAAAPETATAFAETVAADWGHTTILEHPGAMPEPVPEAAAVRPASRKPRGMPAQAAGVAARSWWTWALAAGVLAVLALAWHWSRPAAIRYTPEHEIITELAPVAEPVAALVALPAADGAASSAAPAQEASATAAPDAQPQVAPSPSPSAAPRPRPARQAAAPAEPAAVPAPAASAPPPVPAPQARAPLARPAPPPPANPEEACASASFLARPLCIHKECQKPTSFSHPLCVAERRRLEEEARQRQLYSQ